MNISTLLIRKSFLEESGFNFDPNIVASEEYNLFVRMAARSTFLTVPEVLAKWRVQPNSLTNKSISLWAKERRYTLDQVKTENPGIENKYPEAFDEAYARANYYHARYLMSESKTKEALAEMAKIKNKNKTYQLLYLLLLICPSGWNILHKPNIKHRLTSFFLLKQST